MKAAKEGNTPRHERVVVIGASMGGLSAARALSEHFREVVVIERDKLPFERPEHRPGVAQSWHIHNLFIGGTRELEGLFPGFVDTATALGAVQIDDMADFASFTRYGWNQREGSDLICLSATRPLLELAQRKRFFELVGNARVLQETRVTGLVVEEVNGKKRATGVTTDRSDEPTILADLVVDCSGRAMGWKGWFDKHGVPRPEETVVDSRCGYSSRFYRPRDPDSFSWKGMVVEPSFPEQPRWGVIIPIEDGQWVVTLGGFDGNYPPADEEGFDAFVRALPTRECADALDQAEPLTRVRCFRKLEMRWNHFESFDGLPRFMAMCDAAWAYNPLYGQGMSVAATCSRILRDTIEKNDDLDSLPRRYYRNAKKFAFPLWSSTAQLDLRWPGATGKRAWHSKLTGIAAELAMRAASRDRVVSRTLLEVGHLIKPPRAAMSPNILSRIAFHAAREWIVGPPKFRAEMQPHPTANLATPQAAE